MSAQTSTEVYNNFYANADLTNYSGERIAVIDKKVVAHGKKVKDLIKKINKNYPGKTPFIAKVPAKEILIKGFL